MHLSHIQQCIIQNRNGHISVVNIVHVLWDMGQDTRVWILIYVCFNYIRRDCSGIYSFISKSISLINNFKAQTTFQIGHLSDTSPTSYDISPSKELYSMDIDSEDYTVIKKL